MNQLREMQYVILLTAVGLISSCGDNINSKIGPDDVILSVFLQDTEIPADNHSHTSIIIQVAYRIDEIKVTVPYGALSINAERPTKEVNSITLSMKETRERSLFFWAGTKAGEIPISIENAKTGVIKTETLMLSEAGVTEYGEIARNSRSVVADGNQELKITAEVFSNRPEGRLVSNGLKLGLADCVLENLPCAQDLDSNDEEPEGDNSAEEETANSRCKVQDIYGYTQDGKVELVMTSDESCHSRVVLRSESECSNCSPVLSKSFTIRFAKP